MTIICNLIFTKKTPERIEQRAVLMPVTCTHTFDIL